MGVINPKVVDRFLARKLESWDWLKAYDHDEVDKALSEMDPPPDLSTKSGITLFLHQKVCLILILELKRFLPFLDMGGGKTIITLLALRYRKLKGEQPKAIVFVPYVSAVDTWVEECAKHTPDLKCIPLTGTGDENYESLLTEEGDLFVICYASALAMVSERKVVVKGRKTQKTRTGRDKVKLTFSSGSVRKLFATFDMLVCDEIHKTKSVSSATFRMCRAISKNVDWALGLTGTPFGRDPIDLWSQYYLIDFGETLGETLGLYTESFFKVDFNYWGGREVKFKKKLLPVLTRMVKNKSIRYLSADCYDMPPKTHQTVTVRPTAGMANYYNKILDTVEEIIRTKQHYTKIVSGYNQLRQISSGFLTLKGDDDSKAMVEFEENPKMEALVNLIEDMPVDAKMVIFHHYIFTNQMISNTLTKMKIKHARVWGGQKDQIGELRRFKTAPDCRILVINSQSGSSSHNLQMANYVVFYEQPSSALDKEQAERRCWRLGQANRVYFYDLIMPYTADARLQKLNKEGRDFLAAVLDGTVKLRRIRA